MLIKQTPSLATQDHAKSQSRARLRDPSSTKRFRPSAVRLLTIEEEGSREVCTLRLISPNRFLTRVSRHRFNPALTTLHHPALLATGSSLAAGGVILPLSTTAPH